MSFASARFLAFFAVLFVVYYLIPKRHQWKLLLAGSIFFYWFAGWYCLVYIGVTAVSTWLAGRKVGALFEAQETFLKEHKADMDREARKAYKAREKARRFHWMLACLLLNFGILAVVKYTDFVIGNINAVASAMGRGEQLLSFAKLALPMGISFYTFQSMGYLIDVYRGKYPAERNLGKFALFVTFFPQLIQGPISRFDDLSKTLYAEHSWDSGQIAKGLERVIWGFFKKLVIADRRSIPLRTMLGDPGTYDGVYVLAIMFLYAIDLYADFTGGIDITIGVAQMLGIEVTENFNRPFFSKNTAEYWRRWHMTMGTWFRDYIFYPLSVCKPMLKLTQKARARLGDFGKRVTVYLGTIILWFVTGLWHGASWNFIVWGLLNGVVIIVSQECEPLYAKFHVRFPGAKKNFGYRLFQVIRTFWLMSAIRVLDCYRDVPLTFRQVGTIFTDFHPSVLWNGSFLAMGIDGSDWLLVTVGAVMMLACSLLGRRKSVRDRLAEHNASLAWAGCVVMVLAILIFGVYGIGFDATQFIYNQF